MRRRRYDVELPAARYRCDYRDCAMNERGATRVESAKEYEISAQTARTARDGAEMRVEERSLFKICGANHITFIRRHAVTLCHR